MQSISTRLFIYYNTIHYNTIWSKKNTYCSHFTVSDGEHSVADRGKLCHCYS